MTKARLSINTAILAGSLMLATCAPPLAVGAADSKWTIESNQLSGRDVEVEAEFKNLSVLDAAAVQRQLADMQFAGGSYGEASNSFQSSIGTMRKLLPPDDLRIQSARMGLSECFLKNRNRAKALNLLKLVLRQQLAEDRKQETKSRSKLSQSELQEKDVESQLQFEKRYHEKSSLIERDPQQAVMDRALHLFWNDRLLDALRLTRIATALAVSDTTNGARANRQSEILFLQSMIFYACGKRDQLVDTYDELRVALKEPDLVGQARLQLINGLIADTDGSKKEAGKIFDTAIDTAHKASARYEELLARIYKGNNLISRGDPRAAYSSLNHVFEESRRLVDGRADGLLYQAMARTCLNEMYNCLVLRMSYESNWDKSESESTVDPNVPVSAFRCEVQTDETRSTIRPYEENYQELAEALYHVGYQHKVTRRQHQARQLFQQSVYIYANYVPENRRSRAIALYDLAESYFWSELYDTSIAVFRQCADLRREIDPGSTEYIMTLNTLGRVYIANGDARDAIECMNTALHLLLHREEMQASRIARIVSGIRKKSDENPTGLSAPNMVASADLSSDRKFDFVSGERYSQQLCAMPLPLQLDVVADTRRRSDPDTCPQIDDLWQVLADSYSRNKSYDEAKEVSVRLLNLRKQSDASSEHEILGSLWQLAYICGVSNRLEEAKTYYTELINKHGRSSGRPLADWYYARGVVVDSLGDWKLATRDFRRAITQYKIQLKKTDRVEDQESVQRIGWMIGDLDLELKAKSRCPASCPDYFKGYEHCYWALNRFPLKVYVDDTPERGFGPQLYKRMKKAVEEWSDTVGMKDRFIFVGDREKADVYFERMSNYDLIPYGSGGGATASFIARGNKPTREIDRVHLRLYCKDYDMDKMSNHAVEQLYTLALHEFGHALGLGHSPSGLDVMYWKSAMKELSSRDRRTLLKIYGFQEAEPD